MYDKLLGLTLARFTQLKMHTKFDEFITLVLGQGSYCCWITSRIVQDMTRLQYEN